MHPRIEEILACLDTHRAELRAAFDAVPAALRTARPAPDRWSAAEILEHVALVEHTVLQSCTRQLAAARAAGLPAETDTSSVIGSLPPERIANRRRPVSAPDGLTPKGMDPEAAWADVEAVRARLREFIVSCDGLALGQVTFPHPFLGPLTLYQWLLFAAGHHARHADQLRELGRAFAAGEADPR